LWNTKCATGSTLCNIDNEKQAIYLGVYYGNIAFWIGNLFSELVKYYTNSKKVGFYDVCHCKFHDKK